MRAIFLCAVVAVCYGQFVCQETLNVYNDHVNVGNFSGAADLTFANNVTYTIPGDSTYCPYCAVYPGKAAVVSLFINGFLGHFTIINPLVNLRQLYTDDGGPGGVPRIMNMNDESFRVLPKYGRAMFRVAVVHDFTFEPAPSCLITSMVLYHDPYLVALAYTGRQVPQVPIMPSLTLTPPASSFVVEQGDSTLLNWQYIPGEASVDIGSALNLIEQYYQMLNGGSNVYDIAKLFISLDYSLPTNMAEIYVPGDSTTIPFSGLWMGADPNQNEVATYHSMLREAITVPTPYVPGANMTLVANNGSIAVQYVHQGTSVQHGVPFTTNVIDYFQLIYQTTNGSPVLKIARLSRFFNTFAVSIAITNGVPFPPPGTPSPHRMPSSSVTPSPAA